MSDAAALLADLAVTVWPVAHLAPWVLADYEKKPLTESSTHTIDDHTTLVGPLLELFQLLRKRLLNLRAPARASCGRVCGA